MMRVKDRQQSPPGGYSFTEPSTAVKFHAWNLQALFGMVRKHRIANKIPQAKPLQIDVEEQICIARPELCWEVNEKGDRITMYQLGGDFVKAMWRWAKAGFEIVPTEIFDERKNTCLTCEFWRGYHDYGVGYCGKCGCAAGRVSVKQWMATEKCPQNKWKR